MNQSKGHDGHLSPDRLKSGSQGDGSEMSESAWLKQAVEELRQPVAPFVAGQLRAARRTALQQDGNRLSQRSFSKFSFAPWGMAMAAGLGAVAVAMVLLLEPQPSGGNTPTKTAGNVMLEDLSIMAAQEDLQFYQDLELMEWLEQEGSLDTQS